ncbi:efflux RND transporter periplasmic adaptor subunit [Mangrovibacterium marinum]|uniref:efflux RND transporter periplasmic adaptor subunit n=1 Tax=Mangrovibacterium marinum TaxID=1639118 RepID=UPI002A187006|nr:efflux RND transporter periplasmic adaptor subunit [Mangrovibacterium marinum]
MNKPFFLLLRQGCVIFFLLALVSCTSEESRREMKVVPVEVQQLSYDSKVYLQEYIGTVESENSVDISFLFPGTIEQMCVSEGQIVVEGQLLAKLNTTTLKNTHDLALATLKQAEDAYRRLSAMFEANSLPEIQYIDAKTKLEQAKSSELIARKNLQDCNLYAPQSGVIDTRYLEPGANVVPGTPVYNIMKIDNVYIKVAIPEREIADIQKGTICQVEISALNDNIYKGVIVEKGVSANPISHTYNIKVKVRNQEFRILPGMVCRSYLEDNDSVKSGRIIVPIKAVQVDYSGKRFVWVKDKQNRAVYKEVTLGKLFANGVQILHGLKEGDDLITAGYQNISEGTLVSIVK